MKNYERKYVLLVVAVFLTTINVASSTTYYVSPTGSGANNGTLSSAPALLTTAFLGNLATGDTLTLLSGNYTFAASLVGLSKSVSIVGQGTTNTIVNVAAGVNWLTLNYPSTDPVITVTGITFTTAARIFAVNGGSGLSLTDVAFVGVTSPVVVGTSNNGPITVTNSRFVDCGTNTSAIAGGITTQSGAVNVYNVYVYSTKFVRTFFPLRLQHSGSTTVQGSSFYEVQPYTLVLCPNTMAFTLSGNSYCGAKTMTDTAYTTSTCQNWNTGTATYVDGCGVCGGDNSEKDCKGTCWGSATGCVNKRYYVSTNGTFAGSGNSTNPFLYIQHAINAASYGDTIEVQPGT